MWFKQKTELQKPNAQCRQKTTYGLPAEEIVFLSEICAARGQLLGRERKTEFIKFQQKVKQTVWHKDNFKHIQYIVILNDMQG